MNEESLFHEALARSTPAERAAFLDSACADNSTLRVAVEQLLAAHDQSGDFLLPVATVAPESTDGSVWIARDMLSGASSMADAASPTVTVWPAADPEQPVPKRIGRYEIRAQIGRGGMGT